MTSVLTKDTEQGADSEQLIRKCAEHCKGKEWTTSKYMRRSYSTPGVKASPRKKYEVVTQTKKTASS